MRRSARSTIWLRGTVLMVFFLSSCGSPPVAAPVTSIVPTTVVTTSRITTIVTPPAVTESLRVTVSVTAPGATGAWLPITKSANCEMLAADAPDGTDGPAARLANIMAHINTDPSTSERASLAGQLATINDEIEDIARHAPSEMASNFSAVLAFSKKLHTIYTGTATNMTFDMAEYKVPMLALLDMCTQ